MLGADLAVLGALGRVGRGFGFGSGLGVGFGRAWAGWGLAWAWDLACWAGLGVGFGSVARSGGLGVGAGLGWVGFGSGGRAGLGWVRIWLSVYGLHCTCLLHVFMMSLCLSSCVSQMVSWGLSKTKPGIRE